MSNVIKINITQLEQTIRDYQSAIDDMQTCYDNLVNAMTYLKNSGWKSGASTAYFDAFDNTWKKNMKGYIKIMKFLKGCLENAKTEYDNLHDEAVKIGSSL